jgi:hypothetical protein
MFGPVAWRKKLAITPRPPKFLLMLRLSPEDHKFFILMVMAFFPPRKLKTSYFAKKFDMNFLPPYDSNTNPFVERARRTIFEGVCTALIRSGAPASFWGEAENHKIFTINVLPTVPDEKNPGKFVSR